MHTVWQVIRVCQEEIADLCAMIISCLYVLLSTCCWLIQCHRFFFLLCCCFRRMYWVNIATCACFMLVVLCHTLIKCFFRISHVIFQNYTFLKTEQYTELKFFLPLFYFVLLAEFKEWVTDINTICTVSHLNLNKNIFKMGEHRKQNKKNKTKLASEKNQNHPRNGKYYAEYE